MKILFITRLYSGFEQSLKSLKWDPEGVPTIYNLINKISKLHKVSIIFTAKDSGKTYSSNWLERSDLNLNINKLNANIKVLSGIKYFPSFFPRKLTMILRDFRQLIKVVIYILNKKPTLIYCDSANVVIAYILTIIFPRKPIVVRVLGVCSFWRSILDSKRLVHKVYKLAFKGKFACVIGTQDGSGIEYWFKDVLRKDVLRKVLLNGVESNKKINDSMNKNKKILFVGRLENYKGIIIFLKAMIKVIKNNNKNIEVIIVGDGTLYIEAINLCKNAGLSSNFTFLKSIPHSQVLGYHSISDIYVSANIDGNLINTNLEAISSNSCMIIPSPQKKKFIDIKTFCLLKNSVLYYKVNNVNDLKSKIEYLLDNPKEIKIYKKKIAEIKSTFLKTWEKRIDEELELLEKVCVK